MQGLEQLLKTPIQFNEAPHRFNQGGKEFMQGYEASRHACLDVYLKKGTVDNVAPLVAKPGQSDSTPADRLFIEGYNDLLHKVYGLIGD